MADVCIHIGEMLARNGRMYPNKIALVERNVGRLILKLH